MAQGEENIMKHFAAALVIAVVFYVLSFSWIEHRRTRQGPWEADFRSDASGRPALIIRQPALGIEEKLVFAGETIAPNLDVTRRFAEANTNAPFGRVVFQDPTFLPGTLTLEMFGHEVEALPRVLIIDKKETAWTPRGSVVVPKRN
jgi:hypothetical protein